MSNEIEKADAQPSQSRELATERDTPSGASMLAMVAAAAKDPSVDAEKMKTLADLAISLEDREAERRFRDAKAQAQLSLPSIGKKGEILNKSQRVQSRFSHFEELHRVCVPILAQFHLTIDWRIGESISNGSGILIPVEAVLTYSDGEMSFTEGGGALPFPIDNMGGKSPVQGVASSLSMGKRHTMKALLNIREHDANEGEAGAHTDPAQHTEAEQVLIEEARSAAMSGADEYGTYWKGLNSQQKGFLVSRTNSEGISYHEANKKAAGIDGGAK